MTHTLWLGMQILHPSEWEPVRLGLDVSRGRCVLVDRCMERLEVQWRPCKATPDLARMFEQHRRGSGRNAARDAKGSAETVFAAGGWRGFCRRDEDRLVTQAGRYFESANRLVEVALVWPGARDKALERQILAGTCPQPEGLRRIWQAAGLSVEAPIGGHLTQYKALPGHVWFRFDYEQGALTVHRLGAVEQWLRVPLSQWLKERAGEGRVESSGPIEIHGHAGEEIRYLARTPGWQKLLLRRQHSSVKAWICPASGRLYLAEWNSRRKPAPEFPQVAVGCCQPLSVPVAQ